MPLRPDMQLGDYLQIFSHRKWLIVFTILLVLFAATTYNLTVRELYRSTTAILIIPQRVPEEYVQSTVSINAEDRLATLQQEILSRTRLLQVSSELNLFPEKMKELPPEDLVEKMRKRIEVEIAHGRGRDRGTNAFTLSFIHENPRLAMLGASRLASLFIDENLRTREQQAVGTSEFLESQLQNTKKKLEIQENQVKEYKLRHMGELPQELQANLAILSRLQDEARSTSDAIRAAQDRRVLLESQIGMLERVLQAAGAGDNTTLVAGSDPLDPAALLLAELAVKRGQLDDARSRYTPKYPEVVRLKREVELLEKQVEEARKTGTVAAVPRSRSPAAVFQNFPSTARELDEIRRLRAQVAANESEISSYREKQREISRQMNEIQSKVEKAPRREQELIALTRDYENLRRSYDDLLKKKLEADVSQNLEKRQKGEQFQIIDPANLPERPFKPDRKKVFGISLFLALALGFGAAFGLEMNDNTLRGEKDFRYFFDLPVLASIPVIKDEAYQWREKNRKLAMFGCLVGILAAYVVLLIHYSSKIRILLTF